MSSTHKCSVLAVYTFASLPSKASGLAVQLLLCLLLLPLLMSMLLHLLLLLLLPLLLMLLPPPLPLLLLTVGCAPGRASDSRTVGAIDLGGSSLEVSFESDHPVASDSQGSAVTYQMCTKRLLLLMLAAYPTRIVSVGRHTLCSTKAVSCLSLYS